MKRRHLLQAASAAIALPNGLSNPGRLTVLSSGVAVTQGGPIVSGSLLLHGRTVRRLLPLVERIGRGLLRPRKEKAPATIPPQELVQIETASRE